MGRLTLLDGVKIAYQEWGLHSSASKVFALHGWLDNSNSFNYLGQYLGERGHHVVAIDFAGHGRSSHLPLSSNYTPQKSIFYTKQILDKLEWQRSSIIGHSMGGIIGLGFTSCFPELVTSLTIIDSAGALSASADKTVPLLRKAILEETKYLSREPSITSRKIYASLQEAAQVRVRNSVMFSKKPLSLEAAQLLVKRGMIDVNYVPGDGDDTLEDVRTDGPVLFCHDPRLQLSSLVYHTPEQGNDYFNKLQTPTILITADPPMTEFLASGVYEERVAILKSKGVVHHPIAGSHHLHVDPDSAPAVAEIVHGFLTNFNSYSEETVVRLSQATAAVVNNNAT